LHSKLAAAEAPCSALVQYTCAVDQLSPASCRWAQQQAAQAGDQLWLSGVKDYIKHADRLLEQYDDVLVNGAHSSCTHSGSIDDDTPHQYL
jgi:hypothetical protein